MRKGTIVITLLAVINALVAVKILTESGKNEHHQSPPSISEKRTTNPKPLVKTLLKKFGGNVATGILQPPTPMDKVEMETKEEMGPIERIAEKMKKIAIKIPLKNQEKYKVGVWGDTSYVEVVQIEDGKKVREINKFVDTKNISKVTPLPHEEATSSPLSPSQVRIASREIPVPMSSNQSSSTTTTISSSSSTTTSIPKNSVLNSIKSPPSIDSHSPKSPHSERSNSK